jgi:hypothetical protein
MAVRFGAKPDITGLFAGPAGQGKARERLARKGLRHPLRYIHMAITGTAKADKRED